MTKLDLEKTEEKLKKLEEYLGYLEILRKKSPDKENFVNNFELHGLAERYLQLSIQCILDLTALVVRSLDNKKPHDNYENIDMLVKNSVVDKKRAEKLKKMIGLRNILVHEYGNIDTEEIYNVLQNNLGDIQEFKKAIEEFKS